MTDEQIRSNGAVMAAYNLNKKYQQQWSEGQEWEDVLHLRNVDVTRCLIREKPALRRVPYRVPYTFDSWMKIAAVAWVKHGGKITPFPSFCPRWVAGVEWDDAQTVLTLSLNGGETWQPCSQEVAE